MSTIVSASGLKRRGADGTVLPASITKDHGAQGADSALTSSMATASQVKQVLRVAEELGGLLGHLVLRLVAADVSQTRYKAKGAVVLGRAGLSVSMALRHERGPLRYS